ncbi:MAG: isochorismatase family protein [Anaerolineae bacterium]
MHRLTRAQGAAAVTQSMYLCKTGTWGAEFYGISPQLEDLIITKHRFSAFLNTPLELVLWANRLHTVIVAGVATTSAGLHGAGCLSADRYPGPIAPPPPIHNSRSHAGQPERHYGDVTTSDEIRRIWQVKEAGVTGVKASGGSGEAIVLLSTYYRLPSTVYCLLF